MRIQRVLSEGSNSDPINLRFFRGVGAYHARFLTGPKNNFNIWFLSNTGLDPLKNRKTTKPACNGGSSSVEDGPLIVVY